jgi:dinuclear metal center YbgI/SA1388 family protein
MALVQDVLDALEKIAPARFAFSFDHIGLQLGDPAAPVEKIAVSLDPSLAAAKHARKVGAQVLLCHHPLVWDPLPDLRYDGSKGAVVRELVEGGVAFAAAHTNWDCAPGGINDVLAERIGLTAVRPIGSVSDKGTSKIAFMAPVGQEQAVIDAVAGTGAGVIGLYERCAFSVRGTGTFRPLAGADPTIGEVGATESVEEMRVEMVCSDGTVERAVAALVAAHPYEEPAFDVFPVKSFAGQPIGRLGALPQEMDVAAFQDHLDRCLGARTLCCAPKGHKVRNVVVCGGAAADEWVYARERADAFVTGEVPHHVMVVASEAGVAIAACGHYATENPGTMRLAERLAQETGLEVVKFEPDPGTSGRP